LATPDTNRVKKINAAQMHIDSETGIATIATRKSIEAPNKP